MSAGVNWCGATAMAMQTVQELGQELLDISGFANSPGVAPETVRAMITAWFSKLQALRSCGPRDAMSVQATLHR